MMHEDLDCFWHLSWLLPIWTGISIFLNPNGAISKETGLLAAASPQQKDIRPDDTPDVIKIPLQAKVMHIQDSSC